MLGSRTLRRSAVKGEASILVIIIKHLSATTACEEFGRSRPALRCGGGKHSRKHVILTLPLSVGWSRTDGG
jgi:hypothetical protein